MHSEKSYPYQIHTNRELELMLAGKQPFAVVAHERVKGFTKPDALAGQDFDPHVQHGRVTEHVRMASRTTPAGGVYDVDYWLYPVPGEEWRVEAECLLLDALHSQGWCAHLEWLEGMLLGDSKDQNRCHLARKYPNANANDYSVSADSPASFRRD